MFVKHLLTFYQNSTEPLFRRVGCFIIEWRLRSVVVFVITGFSFLVLSCNEKSNQEEFFYTSDTTEEMKVLEAPSAIAKLLSPIELEWGDDEIKKSEDRIWLDTIFSRSEVNFVSRNGDKYQVKFKCYTKGAPHLIGEIIAEPGCIYDVTEKMVVNSIVNITAFRNKEVYFSRDISKDDFKGILSKEFLKHYQLISADLFTYNERLQQCIFRLNLAQQIGGTEWFGQVYYVIDKKGNLVVKGLCDYPYHCDGVMSLSEDGNYLLTCSEFANLTRGTKTTFNRSNVAFSKFINDSLFTIIYDMARDSVVCDTIVYWKEDTLKYQQKIPIPDTVSKNAYILHTGGDTLNKFYFRGYTPGIQGYRAEYGNIKKLNLIGYYDKSIKMLRTFELDNDLQQKTYSLSKLQYITLNPNYDTYFDFNTKPDWKGKSKKLRFYVNSSKKVIGYTVLG